MKGTFCQKKIDNRIRFFEIHVCEYSELLVSRLEKLDVLAESEIASYLELISGAIPSQTSFLYKLESYNANADLKDRWEFNESITDYKVHGFISIFDLLDYCSSEWGIGENDFTSQESTSIP